MPKVSNPFQKIQAITFWDWFLVSILVSLFFLFILGVLVSLSQNNIVNYDAEFLEDSLFAVFLFRGVLLQKWTVKWGLVPGLLVSSVVFGILHLNFVGLSVFGLIMGLLYLQTGSLLIPILAHALNNAIAVGGSFLGSQSHQTTVDSIEPIEQYLSMGLATIAIATPILLWFLVKNWPRSKQPLPYLFNYSSCDRS